MWRRLFGIVYTADDLTRADYLRNRILTGYVRRVPDGDNLRVQIWPWSTETLSIRLYGIDAPESPSFGNPGQPYCKEARLFLERMCLGRYVYVRLLRRDQHGRAVATVVLKNFRDVSLEMVGSGWAVVYEGHGAEYGLLGQDTFRLYESRAIAQRKGMWADSALRNGGFESPMDYKRRMRRGEE